MPHSGIRGSKPVQQLTAAYRSRPRPSSTPGAKASTVCPSYLDGDRSVRGRGPPRTGDSSVVWPTCAVFKVRGGHNGRGTLGRRSLKTQQHAPRARAHDFATGPVDVEDRPRHMRARTCPAELGFPRKEVIQPHLPVRLPCYDFTPITSPTFDGSLPEGLGHRLRVLPAFVV